MKKIASVLALLALLGTLASCGGGEKKKTTKPSGNGDAIAGDIFDDDWGK